MKMELNGCFCVTCTLLTIISRMSHASYFIHLFGSAVSVFEMRYAHLSHCRIVGSRRVFFQCRQKVWLLLLLLLLPLSLLLLLMMMLLLRPQY